MTHEQEQFLGNQENLNFPWVDQIQEVYKYNGPIIQGLITWFRGRTVSDEIVDKCRVGRILPGLGPLCYSFIARDLGRCGMPCSRRTVEEWCKRLAKQGFIARSRTGNGYSYLVMYSHKFMNKEAGRGAKWMHKPVGEAIANRGEKSIPMYIGNTPSCISDAHGRVDATTGSFKRIKKQTGFASQSLKPRLEGSRMPVAEVNPELLEILRRKGACDGVGGP